MIGIIARLGEKALRLPPPQGDSSTENHRRHESVMILSVPTTIPDCHTTPLNAQSG